MVHGVAGEGQLRGTQVERQKAKAPLRHSLWATKIGQKGQF